MLRLGLSRPLSGRSNAFNDFNNYLRQIARDTSELIGEFHIPPEFNLWSNPVAERAQFMSSLGLGTRLESTNLLFNASGASSLCCDGNSILDAGISKSRRLWLFYQFDSLTNLQGLSNYSTYFGMVSSIVDRETTRVHVGFHWMHGDRPNRLTLQKSEAKIKKTILRNDRWLALHTLNVRLAR